MKEKTLAERMLVAYPYRTAGLGGKEHAYSRRSGAALCGKPWGTGRRNHPTAHGALRWIENSSPCKRCAAHLRRRIDKDPEVRHG